MGLMLIDRRGIREEERGNRKSRDDTDILI